MLQLDLLRISVPSRHFNAQVFVEQGQGYYENLRTV